MAKVGRPRTTMAALTPDWESKLFAAANHGASQVEMQVVLGIGSTAWKTLQEDHKEFHLAVERAKQLSQVWWEKKGRELSEAGSATTWKFNMQNRFGWSERNETAHTGPDGGPLQVEEVVRKVVDA